jgi:hypothetical protein
MQDERYPRNLPTAVNVSVAAKLSGFSRGAFFSNYIETGIVKRDHEGRVLLWSLSAALGDAIDIDRILEAEKRLDPSRQRQREYERRKRAAA